MLRRIFVEKKKSLANAYYRKKIGFHALDILLFSTISHQRVTRFYFFHDHSLLTTYGAKSPFHTIPVNMKRYI